MDTPSSQQPARARTMVFTLFAVVAFAGNSVLCRLALGSDAMDPASFSLVRFFSGALALLVLGRVSRREQRNTRPGLRGSWTSALVLVGYAITFSVAYVSLEAGTGALILFGTVQLTMLLAAVLAGEPIAGLEWLGVGVALAGFVYLVLPGVSAPPLRGALWMTLAGVGWGVYSLRGRGSREAMAENAGNFVRAVPCLAVIVLLSSERHATPTGLALATLSGVVTSGLGYTVWYIALRGISTTTAAVVQLSVPILAALGGVLFAGELLSARLAVSAALVLGGIGAVAAGAARRRA